MQSSEENTASKIEDKRRRNREAAKRWRDRHPEQVKEARARRKEWYRDYHARRMSDPAYVQKRRENTRRRYADPLIRKKDKVRQYGLTVEEFDRMLLAQENRCLICRSEERLDIDHCHVSGKVRGLICGGCNRGLGMFKDSPELLRRAADYLE